MRVSILLAYSDQRVGLEVPSWDDYESHIRYERQKELIGHDECLVYHLRREWTTDYILDSSSILDDIRSMLVSFGKPLDVTVKLLHNYGHLLRLAQFAQRLRDRVNISELSKGTTIIAEQ